MNITPLIFEIIILALSDNINIPKEIAIACDYLEIDDRLESVNYYCNHDGCNRISLDGNYCVIHKCIVEGCQNMKENNNNYCKSHTCMIRYCNNFTNNDRHSNYCEEHKCITEGCIYQKHYGDICNLCKCKKNGCCNKRLPDYYLGIHKYSSSICEYHKCTVNDCHEERISDNYCYDHSCMITGCEGRSLYCFGNWTNGFCAQHKCQNENCVNPKEYVKSGLDITITNPDLTYSFGFTQFSF